MEAGGALRGCCRCSFAAAGAACSSRSPSPSPRRTARTLCGPSLPPHPLGSWLKGVHQSSRVAAA